MGSGMIWDLGFGRMVKVEVELGVGLEREKGDRNWI